MAHNNSNIGFGLIGLFVRHPTASNLLMAVLILLGVYSLSKLNTQFFPTLEVPSILITVTWSGASAEDIEQNILEALEPELRFLDNVEELVSYARQGAGTISISFYSGADMQKAQSDVEQAVSRITTLPEDSEEPVIQRIAFYEPVANISISGAFSEQAIKAYAKQIRDGLLNAGIDRVDFVGKRDEEIWVRMREYDLQRLNLGLDDVATRIKNSSRDLPSGDLEGDVEIQLRSLAERKTPETLGKIELKSFASGEKVILQDVAQIETAFDKDQKIGFKNGVPAIELQVKRALSADTLETMNKLKAYIDKITPTLPSTLKVETYRIRGELVQQRLGILVKNGLQGLVLVLVILFIFLNTRIAFWVAAGIPIAFMGTLAVMYMSGQTINMVSMFALIMMLGIIVDDAIVVGEHTATRQAMGDTSLVAAELGASRMLAPVVAATLTTQAAFFPIFLIQDRIGDILSAIPLVVTAVLTASLIECFLILPGHLRHSFGKMQQEPKGFRRIFDNALNGFRDGTYTRFVSWTYHWRYVTLAVAIATLIICIGLIAGGRVKFVFFPSPEPENFTAEVVFSSGLPSDEQTKILALMERSLEKTEQLLAKKDETLIVTTFVTLGKAGRSEGDNLAQIYVQLSASEVRETSTKKIIQTWRKDLPKLPGVERVAIIASRAGPPGRDIDVRLQRAKPELLKAAAGELKLALTEFPGVFSVADDLPYGKPELILELTPRGRALGFNSESVGVQVRNAFDGAIATRFARGDEEITVRVLRVQDVPGVYALQSLYLRSPNGKRVALSEVVTLRNKKGFAVIQRRDGVRTVSVTADIDNTQANVGDIVTKLEADVLPPLAQKYGLDYEFKGRAEERAKSFTDLTLGAYLALALIYIILAWVFESYAKPFAVMMIIPFGIVGAILGHMILGYNLTIISLIGLLGLSGILVNDSIILVSQAKSRLAEGQGLEEAAIGASQDRLRAVILTSLTTIGGLLPLLFETSRQAQFMIPMAVTMVFGLATATLLVLVLVPALLGVGKDIGRVWHMIMRFYGFKPQHLHKS
ncbi:MAG: efflux RND transporter permease subunit [Pseudomonadota bacterium]